MGVTEEQPKVYTDIGAINWILPRAEFHAYLTAMMRAGLGKRVLFGSDQMYWPEAIGMAVDAVDAATFLTPSAKRDIFHDNACRGRGASPDRRTAGSPASRLSAYARDE